MGLVLLLLLPVALAWGPVSHIYFDTTADVPVTNGADLPDGYAGFLSPQFTYAATRCPDTLALHDPVLAAKLYQAAVSGSAPATYVSFLASYMSHMVGDVVGFYPKGGYLSSGTQWRYGAVNWVLMWPKMQAIDAYVRFELLKRRPVIPQVDQTVMELFAADIVAANITGFNATVLRTCADEWIGVQNVLLDYYEAVPNSTAALVFFDVQPNATAAGTVSRLKKATTCAVRAVNLFYASINKNVEPTMAMQQLEDALADWFVAGDCS